MGKLKKNNIIILIIVAIIVLTISCTASSIHNRNIAKEKAAEVAIQHKLDGYVSGPLYTNIVNISDVIGNEKRIFNRRSFCAD
ncbi:hypothetical protein LIT25_20250 [Bacillus sp. F19]|nr:hypothetical protein LIT25_20250 [Bacillus sp. F19]